MKKNDKWKIFLRSGKILTSPSVDAIKLFFSIAEAEISWRVCPFQDLTAKSIIRGNLLSEGYAGIALKFMTS